MPKPEPLEQFLKHVAASWADSTFVRLVLTGPVNQSEGAEKVLGRLVQLKEGRHLSLTLRYASRDVTKNVPVEKALEWLREQLPKHYRGALLGTTKRDWQIFIPKTGGARLVGHKPSATDAPTLEHDRARQTWLNDSARDWLFGLGVVNADGKVLASMADKHRQIDRYLEIFTHLARDCGWTEAPANPPVIADMGCGKGYLTFGIWHLFHRTWHTPARVFGVETREDLVATTNQVARQIRADQLEFVAGTIESVKLPKIDGLIALHACNTATADAILRGIELGAKLIIVAPCCHQEVRPQLGRPAPLGAVLQHGLMAERMAEWATDGLRTLFLEWAGYRTKVIEFVGSEHTPKNLMIAAVRVNEPFTSSKLRQDIEAFKAFFGIRQHALDKLLGHSC
jgi:SAM-dependent methyltransferase